MPRHSSGLVVVEKQRILVTRAPSFPDGQSCGAASPRHGGGLPQVPSPGFNARRFRLTGEHCLLLGTRAHHRLPKLTCFYLGHARAAGAQEPLLRRCFRVTSDV